MEILGSSLPLPVILIVVFAVVFFISYINVNRVVTFFHKKSLGQRDEIIKYMELSFVEVDQKKLTTSLILGSFGLGAIFFLIFWPNIVPATLFGIVFTLLGWSLPKHAMKMMYERRCNLFVAQMVDAMTILANGVKAGLSVTQSMDRVSKNLPNPISQEFRLVLSQNQLGQSIEDALTELGERVPRPDVQMFVTAVNILRETGGNLTETFQTINYTIRERQKIEKKIEALTAQGIMQGIIMTCIPFALLGILMVTDPVLVKPMFSTTLGLIALFIVIILQVLGGLFIRKLVTIKV